MKKFLTEFKNFITKGNVLDLAVGMIIGQAFNAIVKSMVNDVLMPVISLLFKGDVTTQYFVLKGTATFDETTGLIVKSQDAVLLYWGQFLQNIIDFLIIGLTLFIIVKIVLRFEKIREEKKAELLKRRAASKGETDEEDEETEEEEEVAEVIVSEEVLLLREIRDSLKPQEKKLDKEA